MVRRREFLLSAAAGLAVPILGCGIRFGREAVLKIPEDATECVDLFRFFTDPNFDFERARAGLGLTGEPRVLQATPEWRRHTFEEQKGPASSVELNTFTDKRYGEYLSGIYIYYENPIGISLSTMKANLGSATERSRQLPAEIRLSPEAFTNIMPGQKLKEVVSYSFYPEPPAPGHMKGDVLFSGDATYWDTKPTDFIRFERHPV
jgi:hypothetical protein